MADLTSQELRDLSRLFYERRVEQMRLAMQLQGDYGKWLTASLLLIHGGAFVFLAQGEEFGQRILAATHWWFVSGLMLALFCGFAAWANWGYHWELHEETTNPDMIYDQERWPKDHPKLDRRIRWIYIGSIICGIGSAGCILGAAISASGRF